MPIHIKILLYFLTFLIAAYVAIGSFLISFWIADKYITLFCVPLLFCGFSFLVLKDGLKKMLRNEDDMQ